jgi:hypothetical protein
MAEKLLRRLKTNKQTNKLYNQREITLLTVLAVVSCSAALSSLELRSLNSALGGRGAAAKIISSY